MIVSFFKFVLGLVTISLSLYLSIFVLVHEPVHYGIFHMPSLVLVVGQLIGVAFFLVDFKDFWRFAKFCFGYNVAKERKQALMSEEKFETMLNIFTQQGRKALSTYIKANSLPPIWQIAAAKLEIQVPVTDIKKILYYKIRHIVSILDQDIITLRQLASLAPSMGMLGTVMGLIQLLSDMTNFATIGPHLSLALIATLYGIFFGNVVFVPLARQVERRKFISIKNHENLIYWLSNLEENKPSFYLKHKLKDMTQTN